jgi:hypothetical protein
MKSTRTFSRSRMENPACGKQTLQLVTELTPNQCYGGHSVPIKRRTERVSFGAKTEETLQLVLDSRLGLIGIDPPLIRHVGAPLVRANQAVNGAGFFLCNDMGNVAVGYRCSTELLRLTHNRYCVCQALIILFADIVVSPTYPEHESGTCMVDIVPD